MRLLSARWDEARESGHNWWVSVCRALLTKELHGMVFLPWPLENSWRAAGSCGQGVVSLVHCVGIPEQDSCLTQGPETCFGFNVVPTYVPFVCRTQSHCYPGCP